MTTGAMHHSFDCSRFDEFGVSSSYRIILSDGQLSDTSLTAIKRDALHSATRLIFVGSESDDTPWFTFDDFIARCSGEIKSWLPLQADYAENLVELGRNRLPVGLDGSPDSLYEEHVGLGLQYLLGRRVWRYGSERRFQPVPDSLAITRGDKMLLYDAKAYSDGFEVDVAAMRQFAEYVKTFHQRYERLVGRVHAFVVVSTSFRNSQQSKVSRREALYAECGVPLTFLKSEDLVESINLFRSKSFRRSMVIWGAVFSPLNVKASTIQQQLTSINQDGLV